MRIGDDAAGRNFAYDMRAWRLVCMRVHLGNPAWCLVQRDGTHPLPPGMDRDEHRRDIADLVIIGSHCVGLERIIERLEEEGLAVKAMSVGSTGGLAAVKRGECDVAPIHLMDLGSGEYNKPFLSPGMELVRGYRRLQGIVFRRGDPRFERISAETAVAAALADGGCRMVGRNAGSGTRILIDRLLAGNRPTGYRWQPTSHNAVAAAIAQHRADWGLTISTRTASIAAAMGLLQLACRGGCQLGIRQPLAPKAPRS